MNYLSDIAAERLRQEVLKRAGKFKETCADSMSNSERLAVLAEEFGEVAREVCEQLASGKVPDNLRKELIQTAAVCLAWLEGLDNDAQRPRRAAE